MKPRPALLALATLLLVSPTMSSATEHLIFLGTYTPAGGASRGIYSVRLDGTTGTLSAPVLAAVTPNPTFLALHPRGHRLYALTEGDPINGKPGGAAAAFALDRAHGTLTRLELQPTGGAGGAHVGLDPAAHVLAFASYHAGYVASFPLDADGRLGPRASLHPHTGATGPRADRQDKPHPHSTTFSPDGRFAYVCDLGLDQLVRYRLDAANGQLAPAGVTATTPGAGPRHAKFSDDGRFLHVINELDATIAVYAAEPATGALTPLQSVPTLPADFTGPNTTAEIRLHPNGRFVYGSNRGHDSLAVFARDPESGRLTPVEIVPCGGGHPRNFALSPDGAWLVCANRDSDNLVVFRVDGATGRLTPTGQVATVPQAVCVLFVS